MTNNGLVPLCQVKAGQIVRLVEVTAGYSLRNRLAAMGVLPNAQVMVLQNESSGRLILGVKNSRVVLGRGMSHKIMVRSEQPV